MNSPAPQSSRQRNLRRYLSAGLGTFASAGIATSADASIVFLNFNNQLIVDTNPANMTAENRSFDLNADGTPDITFSHLIIGTNGGAGVTAANGNVLGALGTAVGSFYYPFRLAAGAAIGAGGNFIALTSTVGSLAAGAGYPNSRWTTDSSPGFLGINFTLNGNLVYGWVQIAVAPNSGAQPRAITLLGAAYEDSGGTITAGAVPEPATSVGLLALGAAGLLAHRRAKARRGAVAGSVI